MIDWAFYRGNDGVGSGKMDSRSQEVEIHKKQEVGFANVIRLSGCANWFSSVRDLPFYRAWETGVQVLSGTQSKFLWQP